MTLFEEAMELTLGHEGGWYDGSDPRDPNPTMFGVIQKTYDTYRGARLLPLRSVRFIEQPELHDIYRQYWDGTCDQIATKGGRLTALCLFDISINAGPMTARKLLQRALDLAEDGDVGDLVDDGKLGPKTLAQMDQLLRASHEDGDTDELLCLWLLMERVRFYSQLAGSPRLRPNLNSWIGRTVLFYNKYIRV